VEFQTDHFTEFVLGEAICSFVINRDDASTDDTRVSLETSCDGALHMRFSNDAERLSHTEWIEFSPEYPWQIL
jgi:hypothetical protein